jgi:hypothetical protein
MRFLLAAASLLLLSTAVDAQVYEWRDDRGVRHFSTKPEHPRAALATLPELQRAPRTTVELAKTCQRHGGVNCQAGRDDDGSVICYDGFRDAAARYLFSCSAAKLKVIDVSEATGDKVAVVVRNETSVKARDLSVTRKNGKSIIRGEGPKELDALAMAEYLFPAKEISLASPHEFQVTCTNCDS